MHDPFPLPLPPFIVALTEPLAHWLSAPTLPLHIHELLLAALAYHLICTHLSPRLSARLFPRTYRTLNARTKINWDVHVVSLAQSLFINTLALWVMWNDEERAGMGPSERVWGYTGASGMIQAFAAGYFLWDLVICVKHFRVFGWGLLMHAVCALVVFGFGFVSFLPFLTWAVLSMAGEREKEGIKEQKADFTWEQTAPFCHFLRPDIHPLRALLPLPELPLVLR